MRNNYLLLATVATMMFLGSCTNEPVSAPVANLQGTWKLIETERGNRAFIPSDSIEQVKLITDNYFFWYYAEKGNIYSGAGGSYTFKDSVYTETLTAAAPMMSQFLGKQAVYKVKIEGDTMMYISGSLDNTITISEVWKRVTHPSK